MDKLRDRQLTEQQNGKHLQPSDELGAILRAGASWAAAHPDESQRMSVLVTGIAEKTPAERQQIVAEIRRLLAGTV